MEAGAGERVLCAGESPVREISFLSVRNPIGLRANFISVVVDFMFFCLVTVICSPSCVILARGGARVHDHDEWARSPFAEDVLSK